ncbi:GNAT family N-acetyltransferase [Gelidibacter gilvus]|uniref:GNAT family N-acetyltransferase n=2 Tax=Gelidibacter gilvus TaxID=59602 RepID=A0A4Q0XKH0_9FLAO|nr:GNAT family N-acetyltransferase [Gelidibacter gilvus]RXJ51127.1 GNAT family N-acetyltransferase [Gelidibacter gilvus]
MHDMFVEPRFIEQGYGILLVADFVHRIKREKYNKVTLDADPNAEEFHKEI